MIETECILSVGTLVSAFVGAAIGVFVDRIWRRIESIPLFRINFGFFMDVNLGAGISLTVENVGLDPMPEYSVMLYHPDRGSLGVFHDGYQKRVFPQYPQQKNDFLCVIQPKSGTGFHQDVLRNWLHRVRDEQVAAPHFANFILRLILKNSDQVLFEDEGLGNNIARHMYEQIMGKMPEQKVEDVYYRSKAPFWVEMLYKYRIRKMIRSVRKEKKN
ncbi:MAG: hypothetical protein HZA50_02110 [Planctomycetes bacterium]|nr:hypothetical protein [Planctomycetota bacterium]